MGLARSGCWVVCSKKPDFRRSCFERGLLLAAFQLAAELIRAFAFDSASWQPRRVGLQIRRRPALSLRSPLDFLGPSGAPAPARWRLQVVGPFFVRYKSGC